MTARYRLIDFDAPFRDNADLGAAIERAEAEGLSGLNVTYPFKIAVLDHLDDLSEDARAVGAVNTVVFEGGRRIGHNTDLWGFAEAFRDRLPDVSTNHVLLLGAGGAGVAVAHALAGCGASRLSILDIDADRAASLARQVARNCSGCSARAVTDAAAIFDADRPDGVVNATPMGMAKLPGAAIDTDLLQVGQWVVDIVYFPLRTKLLTDARARGCRALSGAGMAVFQAVRAFELFTGRPASAERMKATFDAFDRSETGRT